MFLFLRGAPEVPPFTLPSFAPPAPATPPRSTPACGPLAGTRRAAACQPSPPNFPILSAEPRELHRWPLALPCTAPLRPRRATIERSYPPPPERSVRRESLSPPPPPQPSALVVGVTRVGATTRHCRVRKTAGGGTCLFSARTCPNPPSRRRGSHIATHRERSVAYARPSIGDAVQTSCRPPPRDGGEGRGVCPTAASKRWQPAHLPPAPPFRFARRAGAVVAAATALAPRGGVPCLPLLQAPGGWWGVVGGCAGLNVSWLGLPCWQQPLPQDPHDDPRCHSLCWHAKLAASVAAVL